jgi:3-hydroxyacyl-[acyl-carrier-protein] dehydratase
LRTIKAEIEQYMSGPVREGSSLSSRFAFPPEFIGFQGHFPEKKILPGVCQVQCALSLIEKGQGQSVVLKEIVLAKYFSPVFPDDEVTCVVSDLGDRGGDMTVKVVITKSAVKVSEMKLRVSLSQGGHNS